MKFSNREILSYSFIGILVSTIILSVAVMFPNRDAIAWFFSLPDVSFLEKLGFLFSFYGGLETNFSHVSAIVTVLVSILFGLTLVLFIHYVRIMRGVEGSKGAGATSLGGLVSGFFGIGCASCGSIIIATVLSQFGGAGLLLFLPFGGEEFGLLAIILLSYSIFVLHRKIREPQICDID